MLETRVHTQFHPTQTPIWNNSYVLCNGKSLHLHHWMDTNIWSIIHLINNQGHWLSYEVFCSKYDIACTTKFNITLLCFVIVKNLIWFVDNANVAVCYYKC